MGVERFRREPGEVYRLSEFDPSDNGGIEDKATGRQHLEDLQEQLKDLQQLLYAEDKHALLIVLQAMDCAGKDGTIRHALGSFDPQGTVVSSFKVPTEEERAHDFLWRIHKAAPRRGMVGIFNRSHYEEVLVVRVKGLKPEEQWRSYYDYINMFEKLLAQSGVTIVKFFLQISPEEQAERLRERQRRPDKQWKFSPGDLEDRALWPKYMEAYEEALTRCNTPWAPWYVVPANRKWYRNVAVSEVLIHTLEGLGMKYPEPVANIGSFEIPAVP